ncbi:YadA C-terminal domain-containing protein, partial [Enterobacter roggenkampii]
GPDPRNFNQRVSLGRNDLLIRTFPNGQAIIDTNTRVDKAESDAVLAGAKADTALTDATGAKAAADHAEITATNANSKADANTQTLASKVDKSIFNADQGRQDHALQDASDKATQAFNTGAYAQSLAVDAQTVAAANKAAVANVQSRQQAQETTIQNHSAQLANHESLITALESQNNAKFSSLENQQNEDRKEYRAGIAGAASLAGLHYVDTDNAVAVGAANFKDAQGYAVGYRHKFAENIAATLSTSGTSNGDEIVAASASYGW